MSSHTYVAIMAGGVGSRFWPGSREDRPKQFLDMLGTGKTLLQMTFERFLPICPASNIYIVTNAKYRQLILEQLPDITEDQILCEPSRNNTGPCVAYTAFKLAGIDPKANMIVAASDHIILKEEVFRKKVEQAVAFGAANNALITIGIQPTRPDSGYGYIQFGKEVEKGIHQVVRFTEKPDAATAAEFIRSGDYIWNSGMFVWNVQSVLEAFNRHSADIYNILAAGKDKYNTTEEQAFIDEKYPTTPNISVDYAIMEKADNVYTIPADLGWSDLGTWASLHVECPKDENDNVVQGSNVITVDTDSCLIRSNNPGKLVVVRDMSDYIIVDEPDVLLIFPKSKEQEIKQLTSKVKERYGSKYL